MKKLIRENIQKVISKFQGNLWESVMDDVNTDVLFSGKPLDTIKLLKRVRTYTIVLFFVIFPLSIILSFYISPIFITINFLWIVMLAFPKIQLSSLGQKRKKSVEEELPAFVIFASVMQSVGINIYESFQLFKKTNLFKAINNEAQLLKRNVEFFGLSHMEALEDLGRTHKSMHFKNLLLGHTSIWRSGGDLSLYLETRAEEFFVFLKERFQAYANNVGTIVEALVTLLVILPILVMVVSFVLPGSSLEQITLLVSIGLPIFAIILGVVMSSIQPASFNVVGLGQRNLAILFGVGFAVVLITYLMGQELWLAIALGFVVPSAISGVFVWLQTNEIKKLEDALPQFLRDITEYKKIGYDVSLALIRLSKENSYNKIFDSKLREMRVLIENGTTPTASVMTVSLRSWFTKTSFFILAYIAEFGGGNPKTLETITRFMTNAKQAVREGKASVSFYSMLIFVSPVIMVFTASVIQGMVGSIGSSSFQSLVGENANQLSQTGLSANFINLITITPEFLTMIKTLIITSSILSAFVIGKAIDFTFYNTWRVVVIGIIAIASITFMDAIPTLSFENVLGNLPFK